jgi:hypothetical protein
MYPPTKQMKAAPGKAIAATRALSHVAASSVVHHAYVPPAQGERWFLTCPAPLRSLLMFCPHSRYVRSNPNDAGWHRSARKPEKGSAIVHDINILQIEGSTPKSHGGIT